jgi:hypothetical protein
MFLIVLWGGSQELPRPNTENRPSSSHVAVQTVVCTHGPVSPGCEGAKIWRSCQPKGSGVARSGAWMRKQASLAKSLATDGLPHSNCTGGMNLPEVDRLHWGRGVEQHGRLWAKSSWYKGVFCDDGRRSSPHTLVKVLPASSTRCGNPSFQKRPDCCFPRSKDANMSRNR